MATELNQSSQADDIRHIRAELRLTAHEVAVSLAARAGLPVLAEVADDLESEASTLRQMSRGKTKQTI